MRAEAQAHVDQINAALSLLRRFLDWDRALRRLDELNAMVEDPALWNNAKAAQEVMRERRRLDEAIAATRAIEAELSDNIELIAMAEEEGDVAMVDEGTAAIAALAERAERDKISALLAGEADANEEERAVTYRIRFARMIAALRKDLGAELVPVVIGQLGEFVLEKSSSQLGKVNSELAVIPLHVPLSGFVSSRGLKDKGDQLHFDAASLREFGRRYALAWLAIAEGAK